MLSFYGITKQAGKYLRPIVVIFKNEIVQYKFYSLNFVLGYFYLFTIHSSIAKSVPVSVFRSYFLSKSSFFIFTSQKRSRFAGKSFCRPLSNMGYIKIISKFYHIFHFIKNLFVIVIQISSFQHLENIYYSFHYGQQSRPSSQTWQKGQKAT